MLRGLGERGEVGDSEDSICWGFRGLRKVLQKVSESFLLLTKTFSKLQRPQGKVGLPLFGSV